MCNKALAIDEPSIKDGLDLIQTIGDGRLNFSNEGWCWVIKNDKLEVVLKFIKLDSNSDFILVPNQTYAEEFMDEFIKYIQSKGWQSIYEVAIFKKDNYKFRVDGQEYSINTPVYLCCAENGSDKRWYQELIAKFYNWELIGANRDILLGYSKTKEIMKVES